MTSTCVKVYLCSNPEDSVVERRFLRKIVFPKLRDHCRRTHGLDFRVIDPYEGADSESWPTQKERLQLIKECGESSPGPFFVPGPEVAVDDWNDALAKGKKILHDVVMQCVQRGDIDSEKAQKYFMSGLENDICFALEGRLFADIKRCVCYVNTPAKESNETNNEKESLADPQAPSVRLKRLCDDFLPYMVRTHKALVYTTTDYDGQQSYAEDLGHQLYSDLKKLIDRSVVKEKAQAQAQDSFSQQRDLCQIFSSLYRIKRDEVTHVRAFLEKDTTFPFILTGGPCTGKSVFLAHCADQIKMWMKDQDPVVIVEFTNFNSSLKQTLSSICHQLTLSYNQPLSFCPKGIYELKEMFNNLLTAISLSSNPLILIIDGLDQTLNTNEPLDVTWLPKTLPLNVKLFMSCSPTKARFLSALKTHYPELSVFHELKPIESKSCNQMLTTLLLESNKRITSGQQIYVNQVFKKCTLPLFVELLHRQLCHWSSDLEITSDTLIPGVHTNIGRFLDRLEEKHGRLLVSRTLQYLTLSRHGLTEAELTDILSCDDDILGAFFPVDKGVPYNLRVPEVIVERLLLDLKGFLMPRNILGTKTLFFVCRHFNLVIFKRYLSSNEQEEKHSFMANYFSGQWACGTAKALSTTASPNKDLKIYIDRQVPGQPWMFRPIPSTHSTAGSSDISHPNVRKLQELPFHLTLSGNTEELGHMMLSYEFLNAMLQAMSPEELVFWLEKTSQKVLPRQLRLLNSILKTPTCWTKDCIAEFALIMQAKLIPFVNVFPELKEFFSQASHDGNIRSSGMNMILFPTPSVPATRWAPPEVEEYPIVKAAVSQFGSAVVIQAIGSAWVWNGSDSEGFRFCPPSELKFANVACSEHVFMLSTQDGQLLLWDVNAPSHLQEVQTRQTEQSQNPIEAILESSGKIYGFTKGSSCIRVFHKGIEVVPLQCTSGVMCLSCFGDGHMICCGQNEGTVCIYDSQTGRCLSSFTCSTGISLFDLTFPQNEETIACVDSTGSVFLWDLKMVTNPLLIKESLSCTKGEMLSTDYSDDHLLICKRHQIKIIAGCLLDVEDKFNAPRGKTFVQALLDPVTHFILALMKDCPFLLVWNWVSGQCVLNVDIGSTQTFKLKKSMDFPYLTAVTSIGIVNWDMDLISLAASTPKSGKKVMTIVVEKYGEHFYTSDGSEWVWRWKVLDGKPESHLFHLGPVESMALSVDGVQFVTIASGDIYVWNTNTNENIHRICGSQATWVLLTPKGSIAVSLSKKGLSRVWNLCSGHVVCCIYHHLKDAVISPESTFLLGINQGDLLAISLWSGYISKKFSGSDWSEVVAFHPMSDHTDYVIVITISGALYSWKMTEETICHQFQFPESFQHPPQSLRLSSDGRYGILSVTESKIHILDVYHGKLCSLNTEGPVFQLYLDICRKYAVYICSTSKRCQSYSCDLHNMLILVAIRVTDGKRVGKFYLNKTPSALSFSEDLCVYIGFEDGSIGVYAISDTESESVSRPKCEILEPMCPFDEPVVWSPLENPDLIWDVAPALL
ncbi:NACHT and WD repeat domain-containing protein 2 isoform X2 [Hoplias malabaricus]|uniref:NACHT and WD repeat domain-containing protein 2 isoform X2 n=1 Tax=Hoplias malabaricus TaxID=27720 RepID=UPI003462F165